MGQNFVASWTDFMGHREYWRMYQSGQFVHLFGVLEYTREEWRQELASTWQSRVGVEGVQITGFMDVVNVIYTLTEIFEFASRLTQSGHPYERELDIRIEFRNIEGFALVADRRRAWHSLYQINLPTLGRSWKIPILDLIGAPRNYALEAARWLFERFGWLDQSSDVIQGIQNDFLEGRY